MSEERIIDQGAFTAITEIRNGDLEKLRSLLTDIGNRVDLADCPIRFEQLQAVHFMRWVILNPSTDARGSATPPNLVLSTNYDLPLADHLDDLVRVGGETLRNIYRHCKDYAPGRDLASYLRAHSVPYAAFYVGTRGRSVSRIRREQALRDAIEGFLASRGVAPGEDASVIRAAVQEFVRNDGKFPWARHPPSRLRWYVKLYWPPAAIGVALLGAWVLSLVLLGAGVGLTLTFGLVLLLGGFLIGWRKMIAYYEKREAQDAITNPIQHVENLVQREDQIVQNQLSHLAVVKADWFRPLTLRAVLFAIHILGRLVYTRGALGGIPTIHFARWVLVDEGRRLLFFSNFDGSWENYLGDFIDKAAAGLTAVWSNTLGCPRAQGLTGAGARDEQRFKSWTRERQVFTQVWYSAYEDLSVMNINNNTEILRGLTGRLSPAAAQEWLDRI